MAHTSNFCRFWLKAICLIKKVLPVTAHLNGEYGVNDFILACLQFIGKNGFEKIIEIQLNEIEKICLIIQLKRLRNWLQKLNFSFKKSLILNIKLLNFLVAACQLKFKNPDPFFILQFLSRFLVIIIYFFILALAIKLR